MADTTLGDRLEACYQDAKAAWPSLSLSAELFADAMARHASRSGAEGALPCASRAADLFLSTACGTGCPEALRQFREEVLPRVRCSLRPLVGTESLDDLEQRLCERLFVAPLGGCARIFEYAGHGPLTSWVRAVALRTALNARRGERREPALEARLLERSPSHAADDELAFLKRRYQHTFRGAFDSALQSLTPEERNLLRLHYLDGLSLAQLGRLRRVNKSTVHRQLERLHDALFRRTRLHLQRCGRIHPLELDSLIRWMQSQLSSEVRGVLESAAD